MEVEENMEDKKKENCEHEEGCTCEKPNEEYKHECDCKDEPHHEPEHPKHEHGDKHHHEPGDGPHEHHEKKHKKPELEEAKELNETLKAEVERLKNEYAKAYADTENMRKRLQAEFDQAKKYRIQSFALDVLPVIDNLERALQTPPTEETEGYRKGVEMIYNQLLEALRKEGVEEIEANGLPFDANFHQALMAEHVEGIEPGMVVEVLQKGYKLKDRILRASMVKVSD